MAARLARRGPLTVWNRTAARGPRSSPRTHGARSAADAAGGRGRRRGRHHLPPDLAARSRRCSTGPTGCSPGSRRGALLARLHLGRSGHLPPDRRAAGRARRRLRRRAGERRDQRRRGRHASPSWSAATPRPSRAPGRSSPPSGSRIEHVGPVGAGDAIKAVNNALLAVNILAVGEGLAALVKAGVPARTALEVLNASSGRSFVSETLVPERVLTGALAPHLPSGAAGQGRRDRARAAAGDRGGGAGARPRRRAARPGPRRAGRGGRLPRGDPADRARRRASKSGADPATCRASRGPFSFRTYAPTEPMSDWGSTNRLPARGGAGRGRRARRRSAPPHPARLSRRAGDAAGDAQPAGAVLRAHPARGRRRARPKAQVAGVTCPRTCPLPDPDRVTAAKHVELEVVLPGGAEYRGRATFELPPGRRPRARLHQRRRAASSRSGPTASPATSTSRTSASSALSTEIRRGPTRPFHPSDARAARRRAAAGRGPAGRAGDQRRRPRRSPASR